MENGYKVLWADHALSELEQIAEFLETNWTEKELRKFASKLDHTIEIISKSPEIFSVSFEKKEVRKAIVDKYSILYYRIKEDVIEIVSIFANRQDPNKKKI